MSVATLAHGRRGLPALTPPPAVSCDVWWIDLGALPATGELLPLLSADERARAAVLAADAARGFVATRYAVRVLLGAATRVAPDAVGIATAPGGKPYLAGRAGDVSDLRFSVSRAGDRALLAVMRGVEVGVDIATLEDVPEAATIVERYAPSGRLPGGDTVSPGTFLAWWVATEAVAKASGGGLAATLGTYELHRRASRLVTNRPVGGTRWQVSPLDAGCAHVAAIATPHDVTLEIHHRDHPC